MTRFDEWSDNDPAISRMREALERPRTLDSAEVAPDSTPATGRPAEESLDRRARIAGLRDRLRLGDTSVIHELKELLRR